MAGGRIQEMAKNKTVFFCKSCGYESSKWLGQCPGCKEWNSFVEEPAAKKNTIGLTIGQERIQMMKPKKLSEVETEEELRTKTEIAEFDRVLGGGIVKGSLVLIGGDPGIGKSTLMLQVGKKLSAMKKQILYVSGEESLRQIKMRADRLGTFEGDIMLLSETNLDTIESQTEQIHPDVLMVDSIQTMYKEDVAASPGSVSQVKECTSGLLRIAKGLGVTVFIIGHVTKEGMVAGPRLLEHMVDTVLYFEGENSASYRILRAVKNRFGSTNEIGVFEMESDGLKEVVNPSDYMLKGRPQDEPGSVVSVVLEGTRPMLVEVQALVCKTNFNMPRRTAAGTDFNRMNLLMAVLEKRLGISMAFCDAYLNVAGGIRVGEPALDLAIVAALLSSYKNHALKDKTLVFGEVGLTGEVRGVSQAQQRVAEAEKLGYELCILPKANVEKIGDKKIRLLGISSVREFAKLL